MMCLSSKNCILYMRNKVLQDVEYESLDCNDSVHIPPSLLNLCCKLIVSDGQFTRRILSYLPQSLYSLLMRIALENGRDRAMQALLEVWPMTTFSLSSLIKPNYDLIRTCRFIHNRLKPFLCYTSCLINGFIQYISNYNAHSKAKLKILDLRGFPVDDSRICFITNIILWSCGENMDRPPSKRRRYFNNNDYLHKITDQIKLDFNVIRKTQPDISSFPYIIQADCANFNTHTYKLLAHLLQSDIGMSAPLKLQLFKIDLAGFETEILKTLLLSLRSQMIAGLTISYTSLENAGLQEMIPFLMPFSNLTSLDLSYNNIDLTNDSYLCQLFGSCFKSKLFRRLDLSNNRLTGCLKTILTIDDNQDVCQIQQSSQTITQKRSYGLEYLKVSACRLCEQDIDFIAQSSHVSTLKELNISENNFNPYLQSILTLLKKMQNTLYILEIQSCNFSAEQLLTIMPILSNFTKLRYLNYSRHALHSEDIYRHLSSLKRIGSLRIINISFPSDCVFDSNNTDDSELDDSELDLLEKKKVIIQEYCKSLLNAANNNHLQIHWFQ